LILFDADNGSSNGYYQKLRRAPALLQIPELKAENAAYYAHNGVY
jgi:hypothetical protein